MYRRYLSLLPVLAFLLALSPLRGQSQENFRYRWTCIRTDSTMQISERNRKVEKILALHKPLMDEKMNEIIGHSDVALTRGGSDSPMSNFVVDAMREMAGRYTGEDVDVAITNLGGIRTDLNPGDIRVYDIYTVSPFDNALIVLDIEGRYLRMLFEDVVARKNGFEAVSNVSLVIKDRKILELKVGGKDLDDSKTYRVATIDFLLGGGDKMKYLHKYTKLSETGAYMRDVLIEYVRSLSEKGKNIESSADGRVMVVE